MATNSKISADASLGTQLTDPLKAHGNIAVYPPLSRLGRGPGLVLIIDSAEAIEAGSESLDPPPNQKWAEEGYAIAQIDISATSKRDGGQSSYAADLEDALSALTALSTYDQNPKVGAITYLSKVDPALSEALENEALISAVVSYGVEHPLISSKPHLVHRASGVNATAHKDTAKVYMYPSAEPFFVLPSHAAFHSSSAAVSHTRSLTFLKPIMGGPYFDLESIWEEHTLYEFGERDVDKTMATMVKEPYVNHVPTMTGGIGRDKLTAFYRDHFVFNNPDNTAMELVSRTVGIDRVIDEFIFSLTHDKIIDWLVPGIPPTGKHIRIPFTSVVNIRGDHLYHEHIAWDQASILVQLGLLPEYLPFPYQINGKDPAKGKRFEYRVPAAGGETAAKLNDENAVESNHMFEFGVREVDDR